MMSLTERINLLNKSNSDSSNKENIEDFSMSRPIDTSRRNSLIQTLRYQFEHHDEEKSKTQRISITRQYSREKKLVKLRLAENKKGQFGESEQICKDSLKFVYKGETLSSNLLPNLSVESGSQVRVAEERINGHVRASSIVVTPEMDSDFESNVRDAECDICERVEVETEFQNIYLQLCQQELLNVHEKFAGIFLSIAQGI